MFDRNAPLLTPRHRGREEELGNQISKIIGMPHFLHLGDRGRGRRVREEERQEERGEKRN